MSSKLNDKMNFIFNFPIKIGCFSKIGGQFSGASSRDLDVECVDVIVFEKEGPMRLEAKGKIMEIFFHLV